MSLKYSKKNGLLQMALDFVDTGELWDYEFNNDEEREYFEKTVAEIQRDRAEGHHYNYSVGDYDDD